MGEFATGAGLAADWFFLRYSDPDSHLRLRFRGDPGTLLGRLLPELCGWATDLLEAEQCTRFAFDTYDREIERYGGEEATDIAEAVFAADSRAVVELLRLDAQESALDRTGLAVLSIDELLAGLGLNERGRLDWYRAGVESKHASGDEYRQRGGELRRLLGAPERHAGGAAPQRVFATRRTALAPLAARLDTLAAKGRLERSKDELFRSYVHLHCNRLLGQGPPFEPLLVGLLLRTREGLDRAPLERDR